MRAARVLALAAAAVVAFGSAGCGSATEAAGAPQPSASGGGFSVRDPWVKAADKGMTAAFGTLVNDGPADVTVVAASSPVSAMELHEMAMQDGAMVMRPKQGGLLVKAGTSHVLEPGGDHLMLMNLSRPVRAGDEVTFTLAFADGRTMDFRAVAKPFTGAAESYAPSMAPR
ncbi:copper chaperone PCu(A)C [Nucisporomicrobium flavum]|uniref:copper chaperone PCu(A)C n=1 Tax=Nucisporomicrobium flavum TaxID=2785915 RepID=UPI0018F53BFC|nr:copper chaperone PCu(A)C [Nucisporomicrobium flavum]